MIGAADEAPRAGLGPAASEAVTLAWADPAAERYGVARIGIAGGQASGLAILFAGGDVVTVRAEGGLPVDDPEEDWAGVSAGGVLSTVVDPLAHWTVSFDGGEDGAFELEAFATSEPGELAPADPVARTGGMHGYEQLVAVRGTCRVGTATTRIDGVGQRGHSWGEPDWSRLVQARTVTAWFGTDLGVAMVGVRSEKARSHEDEALSATIFTAADDAAPGAPAAAVDVSEPRLSTTLDGEGRQRRASFELYESDDRGPLRGAGSVLCGTSLDLGRLTLDTAFFRWVADGREGVGRYDVLRRA